MTLKETFLCLIISAGLLVCAAMLWDKYGYHDENERDNGAANAAHYSEIKIKD